MKPPRPHARRAQRAFTITELLVVVVILGIAAGIAITTSGDSTAHALEIASRKIRDAADRARVLASSQRVAHGLVFDVAGDRFAVIDESGNPIQDPLTKQPFVFDFLGPDQPGTIDITEADFGAAGTTALYDAQGVPVAGGLVTISAKSGSMTLLLDPATGRLR